MHGEPMGQVHRTGIVFDNRLWRAEEEAGSIQGILIEVSEMRPGGMLHPLVCFAIGTLVNGEENMESGPGRLIIFRFHVVAAVVDIELNACKSTGDIVWCDPLCSIFRMGVVTVKGTAISRNEVRYPALPIHVFCAYIVKGYSLTQVINSSNNHLVSVEEVVGVHGIISKKH